MTSNGDHPDLKRARRPTRIKNIVGQTFGRLRVLSFSGIRKRYAVWRCICECGKEASITGTKLKGGSTRSCGCLRSEGRKPANLSGRKFGRLTVISYKTPSRWICRCDCGEMTTVQTCSLSSGNTKSCGCLAAETLAAISITHGHTIGNRTPTYSCWSDMLRRCDKPNRQDYYLYGGRGITVCQEWRSFEVFLEQMGEKPNGMTLGRINNDGHYCMTNCRWESVLQQANNKRNNHLVTLNGVRQTVSQWARQMGIAPDVIFCRIRRGWPEEEAVLKPIR